MIFLIFFKWANYYANAVDAPSIISLLINNPLNFIISVINNNNKYLNLNNLSQKKDLGRVIHLKRKLNYGF